MIPTAWTESLAPAKVLKRLGGVWFLGCSLIVWREGGFSRPLTGSDIPLLVMLGGLLLGFVLLTLLGRRFPACACRRLSAGVRCAILWLESGMALYGAVSLVFLRGSAGGAVSGAGAAVPAEGLETAAAAGRTKVVPDAFTVCGVLFIAVVGAIGCLQVPRLSGSEF